MDRYNPRYEPAAIRESFQSWPLVVSILRWGYRSTERA